MGLLLRSACPILRGMVLGNGVLLLVVGVLLIGPPPVSACLLRVSKLPAVVRGKCLLLLSLRRLVLHKMPRR